MGEEQRHIGLFGATSIGVGAIVGGGILVLAGAAFETTGPSAVIAFALNGAIAVLTALSYAEMSTAFPQSGGAYLFAKRVLSVRAAFVTGWVLWFAYIVAGVLYALGFAAYFAGFLAALWPGDPPTWLSGRRSLLAMAVLVTAYYAGSLIRRSAGGGHWATWGKVIVFGVVIGAGAWGCLTRPTQAVAHALTPFFAGNALGLLEAMGYTFIALQGFEIIAAVAGEVKHPSRTLPRAMLLSLGLALLVYLPLLLVVAIAGVPEGQRIGEVAARDPDTIMAVAASQFMGGIGFWLVMVAALLSTMSALQANILAASRVALTMARDRTLPAVMSQVHERRRTPVMAIYTSALTLIAILFMVPDLSAAGAAASLIFLVSFALAHGTSLLARQRSKPWPKTAFRTPYFPLVQVVGGLACVALAIFQAVTVPSAGGVSLVWLGLGVVLYVALFSTRAQVRDASAQAQDPSLALLRGRAPLVLVPVANPANAPGLVSIAGALAPPAAGRVLLMTVVRSTTEQSAATNTLDDAQQVLMRALRASLAEGGHPEALLTVATQPWQEIARVAKEHACEGLLLGHSELDADSVTQLEDLMNRVDCDVSFFHAPEGWRVSRARRILVPVGGRSRHWELRARLLSSLVREGASQITYLRVLPADASPAAREHAQRALQRHADDTSGARCDALVLCSERFVDAVVEQARSADLLVLGLQRSSSGRREFGPVVPSVVRAAPCATVVIQRAR